MPIPSSSAFSAVRWASDPTGSTQTSQYVDLVGRLWESAHDEVDVLIAAIGILRRQDVGAEEVADDIDGVPGRTLVAIS